MNKIILEEENIKLSSVIQYVKKEKARLTEAEAEQAKEIYLKKLKS